MTLTLVSAVLAASWVDPSGRLECAIPDGLQATATSGQYSAGDERIVFLPFIPRTSAGSAGDVVSKLATGAGLTVPAAQGFPLGMPGNGFSSALALVESFEGFGGVMVLGAPGDERLSARAQELSTGCKIGPPGGASVRGGRIYDVSRKISMAVPPESEALDEQGAGAARGLGWKVSWVAPPPGAVGLEQVAKQLAERAGVASVFVSQTQAGTFPAVLAAGSYGAVGDQHFVQAAALQVGGAIVGVLLVADSAAQISAQQALFSMLSSAVLTAPR